MTTFFVLLILGMVYALTLQVGSVRKTPIPKVGITTYESCILYGMLSYVAGRQVVIDNCGDQHDLAKIGYDLMEAFNNLEGDLCDHSIYYTVSFHYKGLPTHPLFSIKTRRKFEGPQFGSLLAPLKGTYVVYQKKDCCELGMVFSLTEPDE